MAASNNGKIAICSTPPPTIEEFDTIAKSPNSYTISHPTNYLQRVHINIIYGECVALGVHRCVLSLIDCPMLYFWEYVMRTLSCADLIQDLQ